ncbi:MFS transporter [Brevibacillus migulae]|uniref:MFS transporter n=1 Tax=Brevibacillus migulae TaxID=1644114 RepID=UPI00106DE84D|nr:MFS transporter [Brevibacillus migulae]
MQADKKWDLISVASIPLIMTLGNSMMIPILPDLSKRLDVTSFEISMVITVYSLLAIPLIPVAGYLSDRIGRKNVIIPSLIIAAAGGLISGLACWFMKDPYWIVLLGRLLQGVGAAGAFPIVLPLIGDMFQREDDVSQGLGLVETANTFGKVLSPILGAFLAGILWYLPFLTIPVFCLISILLVAFLVKSPKEKKEPKEFRAFLGSIKAIFRQKGRWLYAIFVIGGICMFVVFGLLFYLSSRLEDQYGIDGVKKGLILAIPLASLCLASYLTGKKIGQNKILMKWITFLGLLLLAGAVFIAGYMRSMTFITIALFISGIGIGVTLPCLDAFITEGIKKEERGTISSIYSSMRFIGVAAGPPVVSVLMKTTQMTLFWTMTGLSVLSALLALLALRPSQGKGGAGDTKRLGSNRHHYERT